MRKKILILNPPTPNNTYINRDLMGGMGVFVKFGGEFFSKLLSKIKSNYIRIPVVQLVYAATILEKAGLEVKVIDACNDNKTINFVLTEATRFMPDFIIMAVSSAGIIFERDIVAATLKRNLPRTQIIAVGDMITEMPELITPWFDIAINGEVEKNILSLCSEENHEKTPGIIINKNGAILKTKSTERIDKNKLEALPLPSWHLFPYSKYRYYPMITSTPVATIQASRGCPYGCGYCPYTKNQGKMWRARSAENIFEEIVHDLKFGFKGFFFRDPLFTLDFARVEKLCELITKEKMVIQFAFETRPELLTHNLIDKLKIAGCSSINFGVEDIHPEILRQISRKPVDVKLIADIVNYCELKGIRTSCFIILGLPGSTRQTIENTIAFSKKLFASQMEYKIATPYPGTDLYHKAKKNGWFVNESFDLLTGYTSSIQVSQELSPEYLEKRSNKAFKEYYFSPKYLWRELITCRAFKDCYFALKWK